MKNKKIYRVYAHDVIEDIEYSSFYVTEQSKEDFIAQLIKDHEGTIAVDVVIEYTVDQIMNLLNLHIEE